MRQTDRIIRCTHLVTHVLLEFSVKPLVDRAPLLADELVQDVGSVLLQP